MWMLLNIYYPMYMKEGLIEPPKVLLQTDKYKESSDSIYEFIKEKFVQTFKNKDCVSEMSVYHEFKGWYRECYNSGPISRKDFKDYILQKTKLKMANGMIYGIKWKEDNEEEISEDTPTDDEEDTKKSKNKKNKELEENEITLGDSDDEDDDSDEESD